MTTKICSSCGESFGCGSDTPEQSCWCNDLPPIMPMDPSVDCRCPECLKIVIQEKVAEYVQTITPENALDNIAKNFDTSSKAVEGIDYYINEDGNFVFTKWYHLKRGYCCGNGCKHCPYESNLRDTGSIGRP